MNPLRVGCSPLTKVIYAGRLNKDSSLWVGTKHDVTSDVIGAIIEKVGVNSAMTVNENGVPTWEITVRRIAPTAEEK